LAKDGLGLAFDGVEELSHRRVGVADDAGE
jgi:hypothetical protein